MTKVERIYEIEDYFKDMIVSGKARMISNCNEVDALIKLADEKNMLVNSLPFEIEIKTKSNNLNINGWKRTSYVYFETPKFDKNYSHCNLKSDNLYKLFEFIDENNSIQFVYNIYGNKRLTKIIIDNYNKIKSHEYSDKLIQLLSTDDERNIELVITMLGLIEHAEFDCHR